MLISGYSMPGRDEGQRFGLLCPIHLTPFVWNCTLALLLRADVLGGRRRLCTTKDGLGATRQGEGF